MVRKLGGLLVLGVALCALLGPSWASAEATGEDASRGVWEGPWYRGMSSGKAQLRIGPDGNSLQMTNLDNFNGEVHAIEVEPFDGKALVFRATGDNGQTLSATLRLLSEGSALRGMGKYEGFPLRFEFKRAH